MSFLGCSVNPSQDYQLGSIRQNLNYFRGSLSQNFQFFAENRLIYLEKASFLHIVTKSFEPIFQGLEPIVRHRALKGTLVLYYMVNNEFLMNAYPNQSSCSDLIMPTFFWPVFKIFKKMPTNTYCYSNVCKLWFKQWIQGLALCNIPDRCYNEMVKINSYLPTLKK